MKCLNAYKQNMYTVTIGNQSKTVDGKYLNVCVENVQKPISLDQVRECFSGAIERGNSVVSWYNTWRWV